MAKPEPPWVLPLLRLLDQTYPEFRANRGIGPETVAAWSLVLDGQEPRAMMQAAVAWARTQPRFPSPADLIRLADSAGKLTAGEAYSLASAYLCHDRGWSGEAPTKPPEQVLRIAEQVGSPWAWKDGNSQTLRSKFVRFWDEQSQADTNREAFQEAEASLDRLPGQTRALTGSIGELE